MKPVKSWRMKSKHPLTLQKCNPSHSTSQQAEGYAVSGYKKEQRSSHNDKYIGKPDHKESLANFKPACCIRCHSKDHMAYHCPALNKTCKACNKPGHLSYACLTKSRPRRHSYSDNRSGPSSDKRAESNSVEAGAATCWGYDPHWVKSLIETTIHNDAIDARAAAVTAVNPNAENEEFGLLG